MEAPAGPSEEGVQQRRTIVLDSGALIGGSDSLFAARGLVDAHGSAVEGGEDSEQIDFVTVAEVVHEVRDARARARLALLEGSLSLKNPSAEALAAVAEFSKATGDYPALSRVDMRVLALTWMLEVAKNGKKYLKEKPAEPVFAKQSTVSLQESLRQLEVAESREKSERERELAQSDGWSVVQSGRSKKKGSRRSPARKHKPSNPQASEQQNSAATEWQKRNETAVQAEIPAPEAAASSAKLVRDTAASPSDDLKGMEKGDMSHDDGTPAEGRNIESAPTATPSLHSADTKVCEEAGEASDAEDSDFSDDGVGWINQENLDDHLAHDVGSTTMDGALQDRVGCVTTDFAMQNVMLQMGLQLLGVDGRRVIASVRRYALRCQACGQVTRELERQFCGNCGNAAFTRVSFAVNKKGVARIYLSSKFQPRLRGTKYSIPMPRGGRHNKDLILREDQIDPTKIRRAEKQRERMTVDVLDPNAAYASGAKHVTHRPFVVGYGSRNPNVSKPRSKKGK